MKKYFGPGFLLLSILIALLMILNKPSAELKDKEISEDDAKRAEVRSQKLTDEYVTKIDGLLQRKEQELMTI